MLLVISLRLSLVSGVHIAVINLPEALYILSIQLLTVRLTNDRPAPQRQKKRSNFPTKTFKGEIMSGHKPGVALTPRHID
jgi:hypothetical protein